jgi:hypothetical protein
MRTLLLETPHRWHMLRAKVLRVDGSVIVDDEVRIDGRNAKRGTHDGHIWRGVFSILSVQLRPTIGETLIISLSEDHALSAVVTSVEGAQIHFRAPGRMPVSNSVEVQSESA